MRLHTIIAIMASVLLLIFASLAFWQLSSRMFISSIHIQGVVVFMFWYLYLTKKELKGEVSKFEATSVIMALFAVACLFVAPQNLLFLPMMIVFLFSATYLACYGTKELVIIT